MITLVALICSNALCQDVVVPTENMVAGKMDDPVPMELTWNMCKAGGERLAQDWLRSQSQYANWQLRGVECVPGHYESNKRA